MSTESPPQLEEFEIQTKVKKHYEFDWIITINARVKPKQKFDEDAIGRCNTLLMKRFRANSHEIMEEPSAETSALAFELFDRYVRLKPEFKNDAVKKGSGIWNIELDDGPILIFEDICIENHTDAMGSENGWLLQY